MGIAELAGLVGFLDYYSIVVRSEPREVSANILNDRAYWKLVRIENLLEGKDTGGADVEIALHEEQVTHHRKSGPPSKTGLMWLKLQAKFKAGDCISYSADLRVSRTTYHNWLPVAAAEGLVEKRDGRYYRSITACIRCGCSAVPPHYY